MYECSGFVSVQLGHIDEDCITEMAVNMKRSRQSTTKLVKEVCVVLVCLSGYTLSSCGKIPKVLDELLLFTDVVVVGVVGI